jgi:hypothetical protein
MIEIVRYPGCEQLAQGDRTELGVEARAPEIVGLESKSLQTGQVRGPQTSERLQ